MDICEGSDDLDEEDEYDWITDTEENDLKFKCDVCGTVIEDTSDRFHCDTCSDYDLVGAMSNIVQIYYPWSRWKTCEHNTEDRIGLGLINSSNKMVEI